MLDCVKKNKAAITLTQQDEALELTSRQQLNPNDWDKISAVLSILTPLLYCTKAAEGDNVGVSEVIPLLKRLNLEINSAPGDGVQMLKKSVLVEIKHYFVTKYAVETRKEYAVATVLDPRFKLAGFQMKEHGNLAKHMVLSEMQVTSTEGDQESPNPNSDNQQEHTSNTIWDQVFDDEWMSQDEDQELEDVMRIELKKYLKEKRVDVSSDPLTYWKTNCSKYPYLAKLVRRYHCPPPGSVASERMFSTAGDVLGSKRLSLKPANFECLLFLKYNVRALNGERRAPSNDFTPPNSIELPASVIESMQCDDDESSDIEIMSDDELLLISDDQ